jgi:hypothetical protein
MTVLERGDEQSGGGAELRGSLLPNTEYYKTEHSESHRTRIDTFAPRVLLHMFRPPTPTPPMRKNLATKIFSTTYI